MTTFSVRVVTNFLVPRLSVSSNATYWFTASLDKDKTDNIRTANTKKELCVTEILMKFWKLAFCLREILGGRSVIIPRINGPWCGENRCQGGHWVLNFNSTIKYYSLNIQCWIGGQKRFFAAPGIGLETGNSFNSQTL